MTNQQSIPDPSTFGAWYDELMRIAAESGIAVKTIVIVSMVVFVIWLLSPRIALIIRAWRGRNGQRR